MKINRIAFCFLGAMAIAVPAFSQKAHTPLPFEVKLNVEEPYYMLDDMRMSAWTQKPLAWYNLRVRAESTDPETAARRFLQDRKEVLGLTDPTLADLSVRNIRSSLAGTNVRFSQFLNGVQIYGSEIVVNISPDGYITFLMNGYKATSQGFSVSPSVGAESSHAAVVNRIGLQGPFEFDQTKLVIYRSNTTTRLAWNIRLVGSAPIGDWEALVDAQTGEIFKCEDVSCYYHSHPFLENDPSQLPKPVTSGPDPVADNPSDCELNKNEHSESRLPFLPPLPPTTVNGTGNVFDADPLASAAATYGGSYVDGNDANAAVLTAQLQNKTLNQITLNAGTYSLVGPYAEIRDFEAPAKGLFTQASSVFAFDRSPDGFEAVNTYFFLDESLRYINTTLGTSLMPFQYTGGMRFDPSGLSGADNSHYIGSTGQIAFGEGGVDDAEDSDVILHELGHGLHDWATSGSLSQVNGLSEGTGDYWAMSYSRSKNQWTTLQAPYHWVFGWDGHNPFWAGRITNYAALYPGGLVGQIHTDGQIWSTCLMKIYDAIGRFKTDKALWQGLMMTNSTTNQQDAAIAFRQAGINMGYTSGELIQITNFFTGCGYVLPPFPVNYASFTATRVNSQYVDLEWETAAESQNSGFEVQRRLATESEFSNVGFVKGSGNTDQRISYTLQDVNPSPETSFYRLRQVDTDGNGRYSEVLVVQGALATGLSMGISPNPVQNRLEVVVVGADKTVAEFGYRILELSGRVLHQGRIAFDTRIEIPGAEELPSGVYLLELNANGEASTQKFVKE